MEEIRPMQSAAYADTTPYDVEFSGRIIGGIGFNFASTAGVGATVEVSDDAPFRVLSTPEVVQAEEPLIRLQGQDWRHLHAIVEGGYPKILQPTAGSDDNLASAFLDFGKLIPTAMINGTKSKIFLRGQFDRTRYASSGGTPPASLTGTIRPFVRTVDRDPNLGFLRPKMSQVTISLSNSDDIQHSIRFEQDTVLHGLLWRVIDDSATGGDIRSDGVVKDIRIDVTNAEGTREVYRSTWGQARTETARRAGFSEADWDSAVGTALTPLKDERNRAFFGAMLMRNGDSLTIHIDTTRTADEQFTSVAATTSDFVVCSILGFTPVAGTGDRAAQVRDLNRSAGRRSRSRSSGRVRRSQRAQGA